jgi:hypothetical protein
MMLASVVCVPLWLLLAYIIKTIKDAAKASSPPAPSPAS